MISFLKKLFSKNTFFDVSVNYNQEKKIKTRWDEISEMDIPSSEKIKLVEIQKIPFKDGEIIKTRRLHKKYTIRIIPQATGCFEMDETKAITVFVISGSKDEALDKLSKKLTKKQYWSGSHDNNIATAGRWYDGNLYSLNILSYERCNSKS